MIKAIAKRKSIRSFMDKKVEPEKVESLLRAAMRAPSGINGQPWEFVVVDEREVLTAMQKLSPGGRACKRHLWPSWCWKRRFLSAWRRA